MKNVKILLDDFKILLFLCSFFVNFNIVAQVTWTNEGDSYYKLEKNQLIA
jgi:dipeptidyl-peptidase-4